MRLLNEPPTTEADARGDARAAAEGGVGSRLLERLAERVGGRAHASAVFGSPVERDGVTVIPVARVRWGVGAGGGESVADGSSGSGGGGGASADPVGFIEVRQAGATFRTIGNPMTSPGFVLAAAIAIAVVLRAVGRLRASGRLGTGEGG